MGAATDLNKAVQNDEKQVVEEKEEVSSEQAPVEAVNDSEPAPATEKTAAEETRQQAEPAAPQVKAESGFWRGVVLGVVGTAALAAWPIMEGVTRSQHAHELVAAAKTEALQSKIESAQKDLTMIEDKLAEIAALEAEYQAMLEQRDKLQARREQVTNSINTLKQQLPE